MTARFVFYAISVAVALLTCSYSKVKADSISIVKENPYLQYQIIKTIVSPKLNGKYHIGRPPVNLATCGDMEQSIGIYGEDKFTYSLARIAAYYYMWKRKLAALGYPAEIINPKLEKMERNLLDHIVKHGPDEFYPALRKIAVSLVETLNAARRDYGMHAMPVEYMDECGGGGTSIIFKIPDGAHLFISSEFYVELCRKQGYRPFNRVECNRWSEVSDSDEQLLAGIYHYIGEWPDGTVRTERIDIDKLSRKIRATIFYLKK